MTHTQPTLTEIKPSNYISTGQLLAECFHDNPAHQHFCRNASIIKTELARLLQLNLKLQLANGAERFILLKITSPKQWAFGQNPIKLK